MARRQQCFDGDQGAGDDGDHDGALEMEIKRHKMMIAISYHLFDCM